MEPICSQPSNGCCLTQMKSQKTYRGLQGPCSHPHSHSAASPTHSTQAYEHSAGTFACPPGATPSFAWSILPSWPQGWVPCFLQILAQRSSFLMNRNFPQYTPYPEIFFSKHSSPSIILYDLLICCGFPLLSQLPTCPSTSKMLTKQGTREYYLSGLLANIPQAFRTMLGMWWSLRKYWLDDCMQPKSHVILLAHVSQQPELFFDITFGPVKSSPKPEIMQSSFST